MASHELSVFLLLVEGIDCILPRHGACACPTGGVTERGMHLQRPVPTNRLPRPHFFWFVPRIPARI